MMYTLLVMFLRARFNKRTFMFKDTRLKYFLHSYNCWGLCERTIEIPIIRYYLDRHYKEGMRVLEVGNVTKHYYDMFRDVDRVVVDRDELAYDVVNVDIHEYHPEDRFDIIFSISTFEHMPEEERMVNLHHVYEDLLKQGGLFVLSFPLGTYDMKGDFVGFDCLKDIQREFTPEMVCFFHRKSELTWVMTDNPFPGDICVMELRKKH